MPGSRIAFMPGLFFLFETVKKKYLKHRPCCIHILSSLLVYISIRFSRSMRSIIHLLRLCVDAVAAVAAAYTYVVVPFSSYIRSLVCLLVLSSLFCYIHWTQLLVVLFMCICMCIQTVRPETRPISYVSYRTCVFLSLFFAHLKNNIKTLCCCHVCD